MEPQNYEKINKKIVEAFKGKLDADKSLKNRQIKLSWSNWGFGTEPLEDTARRLEKHGIGWIELHGNRHGDDLGYKPRDVLETLRRHDIKVSGVCGMYGPENDLSSNSGIARQAAIDYIRRQLELCHDVGGTYMLIVPAAVGRPAPYDDSEFDRSVETLQIVADDFGKAEVRGAIEPIRSAEVSIVHTFAEAIRYIEAVNSPGIRHINGDVYHMQVEESHIAQTLIDAGEKLINLHLADSNRCALGTGSLDLDAIIMALYAIDYTEGFRFATPEPLGPGGDPYPAMFAKPDPKMLDKLVGDTAAYWRRREALLNKLP